jgi:amino acid adenylation domain-containing protein
LGEARMAEGQSVFRGIGSRFEEWAHGSPARVACREVHGSTTYSELNESSNHLSHYLLSVRGDAEEPIALLFEHGAQAASALLGGLKAGKICVPLDPSWPAARLAAMIDDSDPALVAADRQHEALARELARGLREVVILESLEPAPVAADLFPVIAADRLAYLVYTSGSTGRPKGILHSHRTALHNIDNYTRFLRLCSEDCLSWLHSMSFSSGLLDILCALLNGASLLPWDSRSNGLTGLPDWANQHGLTVFSWAPTPFRQLAELMRGSPGLTTPRIFMLGSETATRRDWELYRRYLPDQCIMINRLGATEVNNYRMAFLQKSSRPLGATLPGGFAVPGKEVIIVDDSGCPFGTDVPGQIVVRSRYCSPGYWRRPELTQQAFRSDPTDPEAKLYHTGDLGILRGDGCLEFLGRADQQVKIRGHRVEVKEIEDVLAGHHAVSQVAVALRDGATGEPRLVEYLVPAGPGLDRDQLRDFAVARLPDYMVPTAYILLDRLPTTETGKVDRRALPVPHDAGAGGIDGQDPPRDALEEEIADIWALVFGVANVGVNDNFFDLGGDSLSAMAIVARVSARLGHNTSTRLLFESPTVRLLAARIRQDLASGGRRAKGTIPRLDEVSREEAPLSFAQEGIWFVDGLDPLAAAYNIPFVWRLLGTLDRERLRRALEQIVHRHEPLRTVFRLRGGIPKPLIVAPRHFELAFHELPHSGPTQAIELDRRIEQEKRRSFDLANDTLLRALLLSLGPQDHVLVLTAHHVAFDGWSLNVLWRELRAGYAAAGRNESLFLAELPVRYADFAAWQRGSADRRRFDASLQFWRERLSGVALSELAVDRLRPGVPSFQSGCHRFSLGPELSRRICGLARQESGTTHEVLLAGFQILVSRYSGQDDVAIGVPVAGRTMLELEGLIGCFINMLVVRTDLTGDPTFLELIGRVRDSAGSDYDHQDLPFEKLVAQLHPERELGRNPFFLVVFQFVNFPRDWSLDGLAVTRVPCSPPGLPVDLEFQLWRDRDGIEGSVQYSKGLFDAETIERMTGHFLTVLNHATETPGARIGTLRLMTAHEERRIVVEWNNTASGYPRDQTLHELFDSRARHHPHSPAVECANRRLTYSELSARALRIASRLRDLGVGPGCNVGIFVERSVEMVAAMLGVLTAGGAYVPLDPACPGERLDFMIRDARLAIIVTGGQLADRVASSGARLVDPEQVHEKSEEPEHPVRHRLSRAEDLAYIIYTSGSTGTPKGVRVTHRAVINAITAVGRLVGAGPGDTMLAVSSISFDISALELLLPLSTGGRVVVVESEVARDGSKLCDSLVRSGATLMQATPSTWKLLLASGWSGRSRLKVLCGGEPLTRELAGQLLERAEALWNLYGPTETTIWSSAHRVSSAEQAFLIGRPLANTRMYVKDSRGRLVPVGLPGELFIGGDGVAEGYHERPELTAERFLHEEDRPGERVYRTGDRARWHSDGTLEFLGRSDNQVKLRGFRIELGEIEFVLEEHPAVAQSVAIVREARGGDRRIEMYWTPRAAVNPPARELADHLRARLPGYMMPAIFHRVCAFPLTSSGKVDRRSIPASEELNGQVAGRLGLPRNELETKLVAIWSNLLERDDIGIHDNFFDLGGHSLLAIRLLWIIEHELARSLSVVTLFQYPTVAELADRLSRSAPSQTRAIVEQFNAGKAGPAVVMLPSLLGDCFDGRALGRFLPADFRVYGIMLAGDQPYWDGCETLADIARGFMDALLEAIPKGPWILSGIPSAAKRHSSWPGRCKQVAATCHSSSSSTRVSRRLAVVFVHASLATCRRYSPTFLAS